MECFFSIVIPLYNKEESIINTLKSVMEQDFTAFEVLVVNDGSTDNSASLVESFNDDRIRLFNKKNAGVSAARNLGFEKAQCEYICLLDADDLWEITFLSEMYKLISDYPNCGLYCSNYRYLLSDGRVRNTAFKHVPERGVIKDYYKAVSRNKSSGLTSQSSICVKKEAFQKVGGYPIGVTHTEDILFCSLLSHTYKIAYINKVLASYRLDAENRSNNTKPTGERYVVKMLAPYTLNNNVNFKYLESFIGKHILHSASNCIELRKEDMFKLHMKDNRLNFLKLSMYYKLVYVLFTILPFGVLRKLL